MHQFSCFFFFNTPKISRGFHFFALECPEIKSKGRTARTTVVVRFSLHLLVLLSALCATSATSTAKFIHPAGGEGIITACFA